VIKRSRTKNHDQREKERYQAKCPAKMRHRDEEPA
jgi:hypothetical protein